MDLDDSFCFITIVYNDEIELSLLKLQAHSFRFVNPSIVHAIYIVLNDKDDHFTEKFTKEIRPFYPVALPLKIVFLDDLHLNFKKSDWFNQQIIKLEISKRVESKYYVVLDGKNHFVRETGIADFMDSETGKPFLFVGDPGTMNQYYYHCLDYFGISDICPSKQQLLTTTPFLIQTDPCREMLKYIEDREKTTFASFFKSNQYKYTEFYLYSCYLLWTDNIKNVVLKPPFCICIFNADPILYPFNQFKNKKTILSDPSKKVFGLHRSVIPYLDNEYKQNLYQLYSHFYSYEIVQLIQKDIIPLS
jgi:hypothetical protein